VISELSFEWSKLRVTAIYPDLHHYPDEVVCLPDCRSPNNLGPLLVVDKIISSAVYIFSRFAASN
jgi:hypothetical protein